MGIYGERLEVVAATAQPVRRDAMDEAARRDEPIDRTWLGLGLGLGVRANPNPSPNRRDEPVDRTSIPVEALAVPR